MIRVFIVADSPYARSGLRSMVTSLNMEVAGSAAAIEALAGESLDSEPDVILVEASGEAFEAVCESVAASGLVSEAAIVMLSDHSEPRLFSAALRAGVRAVLPSDISAKQLAACLEAVAAGLLVLLPADVESMMPAGERAMAPLAEALTRRENEVLQMLASGLANKEIAAKFEISEHTVKFHVASILGKLGAGSRTEAVTVGIRRGLVLL